MSRSETSEFSVISREQLLATADILFEIGRIAYQKSKPAEPSGFDGMLPEGVADAISRESVRAEQEVRDRQEAYRTGWQARSVGQKALDLVRGVSLYDNWPSSRPVYRIGGGYSLSRRKITGRLRLPGNWSDGPPLDVDVSQQYIDGTLTVNGESTELDPNAKMLKIDLSYPLSDGSRTDLGVTHTLYPYVEGIVTTTQIIFGDYWSGVPYEPFTQHPADSSVYMQRALEMLIEARR